MSPLQARTEVNGNIYFPGDGVQKEQENLKEVGLKKASSARLRVAVRSQRLAGTGRECQADLWSKYKQTLGKNNVARRVDFLNFLNYRRQ